MALKQASASSSETHDWLNLSGFYSQYTTTQGSSANLPHPAPSADVEVSLRVIPSINLVGSMTNTVEPRSDDPETQQYRIRTAGGGLKFDIPGFLLIGGHLADFKKWTKTRPFNTFILAEALSLSLVDTTTETETKLTAGRFGMGIDIFPWTNLSHFTLRVLYLNYANVGYTVYSFGGGVIF